MSQNKNLLISSFEQLQIPKELLIQNINKTNNILNQQPLQSNNTNSQDNTSSPSSINSTECSFKVNNNPFAKNKRLSLSSCILERHDSGLHLNAKNKKQINHKFNKINISLAPLEITNKEERIIPLNEYNLSVDKVENENSSDSEYFYISVKNHQHTSLNNNNKTLGLNYIPKILTKKNLMTPQEYQFDEEITTCIQKGVEYSTIEQKFSHLLKE